MAQVPVEIAPHDESGEVRNDRGCLARDVVAGLPVAHDEFGLDHRVDHAAESDRDLVRFRLPELVVEKEVLLRFELGVPIGQVHDQDLAELVKPAGPDRETRVVVPEIGIFVLEIGVVGFDIEAVFGAGPVGKLDRGEVLLVPAIAPVELTTGIDLAILQVALPCTCRSYRG